MILETIHDPRDIKALNDSQTQLLCTELREFLMKNVSKTGGHLASNLGAVELTVAIHRVFDTSRDRLVFDVGHQCYTHKILTGRREQFSSLRQYGGLSGFPKPRESGHDAFIAGHASNSVSVALGMARARTLQHQDYSVLALIGDGALSGGLAYEGLNNAGASGEPLIVILNDNGMSIDGNVGAVSEHLGLLRSKPAYYEFKKAYRDLLDRNAVGRAVYDFNHHLKTNVKKALLPNSTMFEDMGFTYLGPVNGHDVGQLTNTLKWAKDLNCPVLVHVHTKKGKGYQPAEVNPGNYHGVSAFDPDGMPDPEVAPKESFSTVFGNALVTEGDRNPNICAITAAMKYGTGLQFFAHSHPERFFDVGMAEQHAVTFAAGLASQGMLPVVCIYSTFLQRSYDQIIHDVNLLRENVVFAIDRAGFVPADGETHQGIYDPAFLSQLGMPLYAPSNYQELNYWLQQLLSDRFHGPRAIRYPRGGQDAALAEFGCTGEDYDFLRKVDDATIVLVSYADELADLLQAERELQQKSIACDVIKAVKLYPFTDKMIADLSKYKIILFAEECIANGSIGEHLEYALQQNGWNGRFIHCAVRNACLPHASVAQIKQATGLDAAHLVQAVQMAVTKGENLL